MLIRDLLILYPSTAGSEPKGHSVTLNSEKASLPHTLFILPRLRGSIADPRGPQSRVPVEGSGRVGTGRKAWQRQKAMSRLSVVYIQNRFP